MDNIGLWFKVLRGKYGNECGRLEFGGSRYSRMWKDISALEMLVVSSKPIGLLT